MIRKTSRPDCCAHPKPSAILPSVCWIGRNEWGGLPALTASGANVFLIRGRESDVLVDTGHGNILPQLERNIRYVGGEAGRVAEIWMTHSHWDHSGLAAQWQRKHPHVRVRMSAIGARFIRRGDLRLVGCPIDRRARFSAPVRIEPLHEGDILQCPPHEFTVVGLGGHTPDCVGYRGVVDGIDMMFSGDAIIGEQGNVHGNIGWLDGLWQSDVHDYRKTLQKVIADCPKLIIPGHGVPNFGSVARRGVRNCLRRLEKLLAIKDLSGMMPVFGNFKD